MAPQVPVLVIAESGGAATDIFDYCSEDSPSYLQLPLADGGKPWRDAAYLAACARFLPEIERLGSSVTMAGCLGCCCASSSDPTEGPLLSGRRPSKADDTFAAFDHTGSAR